MLKIDRILAFLTLALIVVGAIWMLFYTGAALVLLKIGALYLGLGLVFLVIIMIGTGLYHMLTRDEGGYRWNRMAERYQREIAEAQTKPHIRVTVMEHHKYFVPTLAGMERVLISEEWCRENLTHPVTILPKHPMTYRPNFIVFGSESDKFLFMLRWV